MDTAALAAILAGITTAEDAQTAAALAMQRLDQVTAQGQANKAVTSTDLRARIDSLRAEIGPKPADAVAGMTSINAMLKTPNADVNASSARYIMAILRWLRSSKRAEIGTILMVLGEHDTTDAGAE